MVASADARWNLYRLLSEPSRLRLLALAAEEELALNELGELLGESQPNISRYAGPLRQAGLLAERRQGTKTLVRLAAGSRTDPVVQDALEAGLRLCRADGSLERIPEVVRARDARTREFFASPGADQSAFEYAPELGAYLFALGALIEGTRLAVDVGTGDGPLLDVLAPIFERVVALDRSDAQLERARQRVLYRGYQNVKLLCAEADAPELATELGAGADLVVAARMLHHAPLPAVTLEALAALLRPGGRLLVIDYQRHADEELKERQADVWMGFEPDELVEHARSVGLEGVKVSSVPASYVTNAADGHLGWQVLSATRGQRVRLVRTNR